MVLRYTPASAVRERGKAQPLKGYTKPDISGKEILECDQEDRKCKGKGERRGRERVSSKRRAEGEIVKLGENPRQPRLVSISPSLSFTDSGPTAACPGDVEVEGGAESVGKRCAETVGAGAERWCIVPGRGVGVFLSDKAAPSSPASPRPQTNTFRAKNWG